MAKKKQTEQAPPPDPEQQERDAWFAEEDITLVTEAGVGELSATKLDLYVDGLLAKASDVAADMRRNLEVYGARKRELDEWLARAQRPLERRIAWLDGLIAPLVRFVKAQGRARSRSLPHGVVGMRAQPARIDITDPAAAVAFAKKHGLPIKEEPYKKPFKEYVEKGGKLSKGSGVEYVPKDLVGKPYWQVRGVFEEEGHGEEEE